ncbi:MAG: hypothetical protein PHU25_20220 [Deltaproteobacteria bacterium]|nr:hypothetical protein [Deltaproteobacteria bacterium]
MTAMLCASLGACSTTPASEGLDGGTDDGGADTELVCDWQVTERPNGVGILYAVWGLSSTDVYATSGNIYHFDGAVWSDLVKLGEVVGKEEPGASGIWGASDKDIFAVGEYIWHYWCRPSNTPPAEFEQDTEPDTDTVQQTGDPCSDQNPWPCNPVTNEGCDGEDDACDWGGGSGGPVTSHEDDPVFLTSMTQVPRPIVSLS